MAGRVPVQLSEADIKLAHYIARNRNVNEGKMGANNWTSETSYDTNLQGAMGEVAIARQYDVEPDTVFADVGGGGAFDLEIKGYNVEVKTTPYFHNVKLMVAVHTFKDADIYFRCSVDTEKGYCEIVGWLWGYEVKGVEAGYWMGNDNLPLSYIHDEESLRRPKPRRDKVIDYSILKVAPGVAIKKKPERDLWQGYEWPQLALECERKYGCEVARLYPYVGDVKPPLHPRYGTPMQRTNRVTTHRGAGLLLQANAGSCMVLLDAEGERAATEKAKAEAKAKREKKKPKKARYGVELPAGTRFHEREVVPEWTA